MSHDARRKAVFISYSHDSEAHRSRVLALAERLRADGIAVQLDRYVPGTPDAGWPRWMMDELDRADFVLVICTDTYRRRFRGHEEPGTGKGAGWEGAIITQHMYDAPHKSARFVPVMFSREDERFIPDPLRRHTHYLMESGYGDLLGFLTGRAGVTPWPLGKPPATNQAPFASSRIVFSWSGRPALPRHFVGRARQLSDLDTAIVRSAAPIVIVCAIGGQGKTTLVAKWLSAYEQAATHDFDQVCYFSAYRFGVEYIGFLEFAVTSLDAEPALNASAAVLSRRLIAILRRTRTLLVVDGIERWLQGGQTTTTPDAGWTTTSRAESNAARGFGHLLQEITSIRNGSKLVMTTRAIPQALDNVSADAVTQLQGAVHGGLSGLDEREGLLLLNRLEVRGSEAAKRECASELEGHPLAMTLLAGVLHRLGTAIESRRSVYPLLGSRGEALRAILRQAESLCGGDVEILQAAALCPEDAPVEAVLHAIDRAAEAQKVRLTISQLEDWGLMALAGPDRNLVQLHPLVRVHFAATVADARPLHARLSAYFESLPISGRAHSLSRVAARIWSVEHAAASGDYDRALRLLLETPLVTSPSDHGSKQALSAWFQTFGQSGFELEWTSRLAVGAPQRVRRVLLNSMVIAAQKCGMIDTANRLIQEALAGVEGDNGS